MVSGAGAVDAVATITSAACHTLVPATVQVTSVLPSATAVTVPSAATDATPGCKLDHSTRAFGYDTPVLASLTLHVSGATSRGCRLSVRGVTKTRRVGATTSTRI